MKRFKKVEIAKVRGQPSAATEKKQKEDYRPRSISSKAPFRADENSIPPKKLQQIDAGGKRP
jgi:hypothetical protein